MGFEGRQIVGAGGFLMLRVGFGLVGGEEGLDEQAAP